MRQHGVVHPDLMERVQPNFYPSLCTIGTATVVDDPFGEPVSTWVDLEDHVQIPCRISPTGTREQRSAEQAYAAATHIISLNGYYPAIDAHMQATVDGITYQIEGDPQSDGNKKTTRLHVRKID